MKTSAKLFLTLITLGLTAALPCAQAAEKPAKAGQRAKAAARRRRDESVNHRLTQLMSYLQHDNERAAAVRAEATAGDRILVKSSGEIFFLKAEAHGEGILYEVKTSAKVSIAVLYYQYVE